MPGRELLQQGNLWISTDGQPSTFQRNDGFYTPNIHALFVAIQHPGEGSTLDNPSSTWPDGTIPPRPSVIVVEKTGGGSRVIGS